MSKQDKKQVVEGVRVAKEGIAECWADQQAAQGNEQMTVSISMPGKNISVTTDSAEEIGNILKLAGINVTGATPEVEPTVTAIAVEPESNGAPEAELVPMGAQTMAQAEPESAEEPGEEEQQEESSEEMIRRVPEEEDMEEATQTPSSWTDSQGNTHPATKVQGSRYGNEPEEEEKDEEVDEAIAALRKYAGIQETSKPDFLDLDKDGDTEEPMKQAADQADEKEVDESVEEDVTEEANRILRLAGVNEWANSPEDNLDDAGETFDSLPSSPGKGAGHSDFGQNRANNQGENPMGAHDETVEEAFATAMGEYRKFVSESIARKK